MAEVRLQNVAGLQFADAAKLPARGQALARGDGGAHAAPDFQQGVGLLRRNGLLAEEGVKLLHRADVLDGLAGGGAAMEVDHDVHASPTASRNLPIRLAKWRTAGSPIRGSESGTITTFNAR